MHAHHCVQKRVVRPDIVLEISDAISIGKAAQLGVAVATLRRWHRQGRLAPVGHTIGGHRHYERESVRAIVGSEVREASNKTICYARVSSHDQSERLKT